MDYKKIYTISMSFFVMLTIAFTSGIRGLLVPNFMNSFHVESAEIGILFSLTTGVSVLGAFFTAPLCQKYGYKLTIFLGLIINVIAYFLTSLTNDFMLFCLGYCFLTLGVTLAVTSLNTVITVFKVSFQAVLVNMIHFFFGLGVTISQKFGGDLVSLGYDWHDFFRGMSFIYLAAIVVVLFTSYPYVNQTSVAGGYLQIPRLRHLLLLCAALGLYVSAELQTGNWMINYLNKVYGYNESKAGIYAAIFFGTFSIGRFFGGFIAEKLGYVKSVSIFLSLACIFYITGLLLGEKGLMIIACSGIFFSLVFPTVTLYVSNLYPHHKAQAISLVSTICNFLSLVSSFLIGFLNDWIGTGPAFWLIPICLVFSAVLFIGTTKSDWQRA